MTDTNESDVQIMKVDKRGRVRTPAKRRESLLEEYDRSGLSGKQFAELSGLKYQTLATWLQKRRRQAKVCAKPADTARWLEAVVEQAQAGDGKDQLSLVVELPGGARVGISHVKQVSLAVSLLRGLEKSC